PLALELRDIRAGDEGLAAGAGEHHDPHLVVFGEVLEDLAGRRPHVERHGIVPLGVVEDHVADAPILARQHFLSLGHVVHNRSSALVRIPQTALALCSAAISLALNPNSLSTASVCWPSPGGGATSLLGVRESDIGCPAMRNGFLSLVFTGCATP